MIVQEIISENLFPVSSSATGKEVWDDMMREQVFDLPVIDDRSKLIGYVSLNPSMMDSDQLITNWIEHTPFTGIYELASIWTGCLMMNQSDWATIPVLNADQEVIGIAQRRELVTLLAESLSLKQEGNFVILEMSPHDYSMAKIGGIIEQENVRVLMSWIDPLPESNRIRLTIKVNTSLTERIEAGLYRFGYEVVTVLGKTNQEGGFQDRLDSLMKYLDI